MSHHPSLTTLVLNILVLVLLSFHPFLESLALYTSTKMGHYTFYKVPKTIYGQTSNPPIKLLTTISTIMVIPTCDYSITFWTAKASILLVYDNLFTLNPAEIVIEYITQNHLSTPSEIILLNILRENSICANDFTLCVSHIFLQRI
jgi:hypothetical protein